MVDSLGERFTSLWGRCLRPGSRDDGAAAVWRDVASRYGEPHRHYHGTRHLAHILRQFDLVADRLARPDQVEVALWFHDVIVQPGQRDNEERSAAYFRETANGRMAPDFVEGVVDLILHTTHRGAPRDADHRYICDIDLSTFGSPWGEFLDNSAAIKAEFQGPESDYYRAEQGFLESLLARQRIFLTDFFHDRYEARARDNIRRFISLLEQAQPA
jgi:predicted metal-dependent HD superfamily phosphohydrolase